VTPRRAADAPDAPGEPRPKAQKTKVAALGRPSLDRLEPVSIYKVNGGIWRCECGKANKITSEACGGKVASGGACTRRRPRIRIGTSIPAGLAIRLVEKSDSMGIGLTSALIIALNAWLAEET